MTSQFGLTVVMFSIEFCFRPCAKHRKTADALSFVGKQRAGLLERKFGKESEGEIVCVCVRES